MLSNTSLLGQSSGQPQALIPGFGQSDVRPMGTSKSEAMSSFGAQRSQMRAQTCIFSMTVGEAQANSDIVTSKMWVFSTPSRVFFDFRSSMSFVSSAFTLYVDQELGLLKKKLEVTTVLRGQILYNTVFKGCEVLV